MTATSAAPTATQIVITTAVAGIAANTAFTITLSGLTMGPANAGSATGITVQTDTANTIASAGVPSGGIGSSVTALSISPSSTGLAVAAVTVIVRFTTSAAGLIAAGGRISLGFPTGWFDRTVTPANNAAGTSSVPTLTASSVIAGNSITITTAVADIAAVTAFTITLTGLKTGPSAVAAGVFSVATSADFAAAEVTAPALTNAPTPTPAAATASSAAVSVLALLACLIALI